MNNGVRPASGFYSPHRPDERFFFGKEGLIMTKYIFVTGGVVSGLGKGITAASLGRLLKARGLKVAAQKLENRTEQQRIQGPFHEQAPPFCSVKIQTGFCAFIRW